MVRLFCKNYAKKGYTIVLIGHRNHVEVQGTVGEAPKRISVVGTVGDVEKLKVLDEDKVGYITQTTLSVDDTEEIIKALKKKVSKNKRSFQRRYLLCYAE